ncbi:hypothetical protein OK016_27735 [Vibrio chagasii]|nr:hypothetical protein [Vibrio chagasii]
MQTELEYVDDKNRGIYYSIRLTSARIMLWMIVLFFIAAMGGPLGREIDKVTVGQGKADPLRRSKLCKTLKVV